MRLLLATTLTGLFFIQSAYAQTATGTINVVAEDSTQAGALVGYGDGDPGDNGLSAIFGDDVDGAGCSLRKGRMNAE